MTTTATDPRTSVELRAITRDTLRTALARVLHAAAPDGAPPILQTVLFEGTVDYLRLVAADNYRIAIAPVAAGDYSALGRLPVHIEGCARLRAFLRGTALVELARVGVPSTKGDDQLALIVTSGHRVLTLPVVHGSWPDYVAAMAPAREKAVRLLGVRADYLAQALLAQPKGQVVTLLVGGERDAFMVKTTDGYEEFIMPVRLVEP